MGDLEFPEEFLDKLKKNGPAVLALQKKLKGNTLKGPEIDWENLPPLQKKAEY